MSKLRRKRKIGFLRRSEYKGGKKIIKRRIRKGRKRINVA
jgi:ribosomal protein L34